MFVNFYAHENENGIHLCAAVEVLIFVVSRVGKSGAIPELNEGDKVELAVEDGHWSNMVENCTEDTVEGV